MMGGTYIHGGGAGMPDDLVSDLRAVDAYHVCHRPAWTIAKCQRAADRIEALERLYVGALNDGERVYGDLVECRGMVDTARREALEEAAKVCERGVDTPHPTVEGHIMKNFGQSPLLAAAIRALKETE